MPGFIEQDVRAMRGVSSTEWTVLLVGCEDDRDGVSEAVEKIGAEVTDRVGRAALRVSIQKRDIDDLCELEGVASVERDRDDVRPQNQGNLKRRRDSTM
jgi:hypothetical protein